MGRGHTATDQSAPRTNLSGVAHRKVPQTRAGNGRVAHNVRHARDLIVRGMRDQGSPPVGNAALVRCERYEAAVCGPEVRRACGRVMQALARQRWHRAGRDGWFVQALCARAHHARRLLPNALGLLVANVCAKEERASSCSAPGKALASRVQDGQPETRKRVVLRTYGAADGPWSPASTHSEKVALHVQRVAGHDSDVK